MSDPTIPNRTPHRSLIFLPSIFLSLGFEKATILLVVGSSCILLVLICGIILCRLDMSSSNSK